MSREIDREDGSSSRLTSRRKVLMQMGAAGTILGFSGVASAEQDDTTHFKKSEDVPGVKDESITIDDIHDKSPEEIFEKELLEMSAEEQEQLVEDRWDEGGESNDFAVASVNENCFSDVVDSDNIPAIDLEGCLVDEGCAIEFEFGVFGQTGNWKLETCPHIVNCSKYTVNFATDIVEFDTCYDESTGEARFTIEHCGFRTGQGWNCHDDSVTYQL